MKLATKTAKENGKQVITTANNYIETLYYLTSREQPNYRSMAKIDEKNGIITFTLYAYFFNKWKIVYNQDMYINVIK